MRAVGGARARAQQRLDARAQARARQPRALALFIPSDKHKAILILLQMCFEQLVGLPQTMAAENHRLGFFRSKTVTSDAFLCKQHTTDLIDLAWQSKKIIVSFYLVPWHA